jgi:hypothetical protein
MTCAAIAMIAGFNARAALHTNTVTVAAGQTNGITDITLSPPLIRDATAELNCLSVENVSGYGTGTVVFASYDFGREVAVSTAASISPGVSSTVWPMRTYVPNTATNAESYLVRTLRVRVGQASTNSTPTVYRIGVITR